MAKLRPGTPYPLGATWDGLGVNFALFSEHAEGVDLCLFDSPDATSESRRIPLVEQTDQVWHLYLSDIFPGQLYGYRVYGRYVNVSFVLPKPPVEKRWEVVLDTAERGGKPSTRRGLDRYPLAGRSVVVLRSATVQPARKKPR